MKYLTYLNILFGDNYVQNSGNCKKGKFPENNLGIKYRTKTFLSINCHNKNVTLKNRHIDLIAPNFTNFDSYHTPILCQFLCLWDKQITKSFWILKIDTVDVQMTKWLHLSFFIFKSAGEGEGWFEDDST